MGVKGEGKWNDGRIFVNDGSSTLRGALYIYIQKWLSKLGSSALVSQKS